MLKLQESLLDVVIILTIFTAFLGFVDILDRRCKQTIWKTLYNLTLSVIGVLLVKYLDLWSIPVLSIVIMIKKIWRSEKIV